MLSHIKSLQCFLGNKFGFLASGRCTARNEIVDKFFYWVKEDVEVAQTYVTGGGGLSIFVQIILFSSCQDLRTVQIIPLIVLDYYTMDGFKMSYSQCFKETLPLEYLCWVPPLPSASLFTQGLPLGYER